MDERSDLASSTGNIQLESVNKTQQQREYLDEVSESIT